MSFDYDLFVIGGGSGGVRAARVAAAEGARVGLAEESRMGGTCVIRGCVPKKLMVFASGYPGHMADAAAYGWDVTAGGFDWGRFKGQLETELDRLEGVYERLLNNSGVDWVKHRAVVTDAHTVMLDNGESKTAKTILVATGGWPFVPEFPGSDLAVTSNEMFHLEALPKRLLIVGGGYIACEFAGIMNGLGVEVTQFFRGEQILRGFDRETVDLVADQMGKAGIALCPGTNTVSMEKTAEGILVHGTDGSQRVFDLVMFATGRKPNTDSLGLDGAGVEMAPNGAIKVDEFSRTAVPSIYAIGDATDRVNLTPVAIREAMAFVETVFKGNPTAVDHDLIPSAIFTQPEIGTTGLSEEDAVEKGIAVDIYTTSFKAMQSGFAGREERVFMKLIVRKEDDVVIGCHIVAPGAGEMIQLAGIAVKMGATKADFDRTCAVHPTMAEELVTMRNPTRSA
ncbi:glutathione-disulfide reductase [Mangrovicoccus algicola]|uniref:Glutathione reductase n=1 Tax=Mangrovicoccus algicola TaxID=2771008 RepID=A0A8J7CMI2_9RHOB|nr:glutathione-disulfide reductase [Mangrovicoccus algicola]MBE3640471.1 glutathione-disulfide reductase [Mangrovicoccus algicola]